MAESSLSLTYAAIVYQVARYLGWSTDTTTWSSTQSADFAAVVREGLRSFYFPALSPDEPQYEWSFLRRFSTVTFAAGDATYDLPDDFACIVPESAMVSSGRVAKIDAADWQAKTTVSPRSGQPIYFAVRPKAHSPTGGQRWELLVYPTPDSTGTFTYAYAHVPDTLSETNIYPAGGAVYSQVIMQSIMAAAESLLDDNPTGPHRQAFSAQLASAIRADRILRSVSPETTAQGASA